RLGAVARTEDAIRRRDQISPWRRGMRLLAEPLDKLDGEAPLELADLHADCRLREMQLAGCGGEAPALDHCNEGPQLIQVEAAHLKASIIETITIINLHY